MEYAYPDELHEDYGEPLTGEKCPLSSISLFEIETIRQNRLGTNVRQTQNGGRFTQLRAVRSGRAESSRAAGRMRT